MRRFYYDEGPLDTLLQIAARPVGDGDLVSKSARDDLVNLGWVSRCHGWNVITREGASGIRALKLGRYEDEAYGKGHAVDQCSTAGARMVGPERGS